MEHDTIKYNFNIRKKKFNNNLLNTQFIIL